MSGAAVQIHIDGAARGNPGPAAFAYIIRKGGTTLHKDKAPLGTKTNNAAEYTALLRALQKAVELGIKDLEIYSDSELLVKQMRGEYRVKNKDLQDLYEEAKELEAKVKPVRFQHIPRAQNSEADRMCNEALDGESGAAPRPASGGARGKAQVSEVQADAVRKEAVDCLRTAATLWSKTKPSDSDLAFVWDQLWSILEEHGVVRAPSR